MLEKGGKPRTAEHPPGHLPRCFTDPPWCSSSPYSSPKHPITHHSPISSLFPKQPKIFITVPQLSSLSHPWKYPLLQSQTKYIYFQVNWCSTLKQQNSVLPALLRNLEPAVDFGHDEIGKDITFTNRVFPHGQIYPSYTLIQATIEKM